MAVLLSQLQTPSSPSCKPGTTSLLFPTLFILLLTTVISGLFVAGFFTSSSPISSFPHQPLKHLCTVLVGQRWTSSSLPSPTCDTKHLQPAPVLMCSLFLLLSTSNLRFSKVFLLSGSLAARCCETRGGLAELPTCRQQQFRQADVANIEFTRRHRHCALVTSSTKAYLMRRQNDCIAHVKKKISGSITTDHSACYTHCIKHKKYSLCFLCFFSLVSQEKKIKKRETCNCSVTHCFPK